MRLDRYLHEMVGLAGRGLDPRGRQMNSLTGTKLALLTGNPKYDAWFAALENDELALSLPTPRLILAQWYAGHGELERAVEQYGRLPPWPGWRIPRFAALPVLNQRAQAPATIGNTEGAAAYERLYPWAQYFVVGGSGLVAMAGSAQVTLGRLAACLGQAGLALRHLRAAVDANRRAGLPPFEAEARCELATVLTSRGRPEDRSEALIHATDAAQAAARLGMVPLRGKADRLAETLRGARQADGSAGLTRRELEIAGLIARSLTNRQIAGVLHIAGRTAENHVQHILTKLGLQNRTQIATWATAQGLVHTAPG